MSMKYKLIFVAIAVAFLSIIGGIVFVYFGNQGVDATPQSLEVQKIDGDYCLVAQYNPKYAYRFVIEQKLGDSYCKISQVDSENNIIVLKGKNLNAVPGNSYRFTASYLAENNVEGAKSNAIMWTVPEENFVVDYSHVELTNTTLTWNQVDFATGYIINLVDEDLQVTSLTSETNSLDVSSALAGNYRVYVAPTNNSVDETNAQFGAGKQVILKKTAEIVVARLIEENLFIVANDRIEKFEIYNGDELIATVLPDLTTQNEEIEYTVNNCAFLFAGLDFQIDDIKIKALATPFVFESELVRIVN